jgi:hypothetical protein
MKNGQVPIHLWGRWCPSDFLEDELVKLCASRGDTVSLAVYFMVLQASHRGGGDLPADAEELAAVLGMPRRIVKRGLALWLERGKLLQEDGRIFHHRVRNEVADTLAFRELQSERGKRGNEVRWGSHPRSHPRSDRDRPPTPTPTPTPNTPPKPPSDEGGQPGVTFRVGELEAYAREIGKPLSRPGRRRARKLLEDGRTDAELRAFVDQGIFEETLHP